MLGKRKRDLTVVPRSVARQTSDSGDSHDGEETSPTSAQELFRRHFESTFQPLPEIEISTTPSLLEDEDDKDIYDGGRESEGSAWDGISSSDDDEDVNRIEVVDHASATPLDDGDDPARNVEGKTFMTSKPPSTHPSQPNTAKQKPTPKETAADAANLKNDLDLQRLLRESHLLSKSRSSTSSTSNTTTSPSLRHKALDMRLQSLGSKTSLYTQENMPLAHRRGIVAKATSRETTRRKDARENGVVLEKVTKMKTANTTATMTTKRDRGVGAPGVGRFQGATLRLSRRDVSDIQGSGQMRGRDGKRGRRG